MESRLLLNVVIAQRATIFELFARENQTLLIRRNSFLVLDLGFHVIDRVRGFDIQGNGLAGKGLDKDLQRE